MRKYQIISDTASDIPDSIVEQWGITTVPFYVCVDGENYLKSGIEIKNEEFYETISNKDVFPKTSQPTIQQYVDAFEPFLNEGKDIFCVCISSKLSGSFQSAINAKNMLADVYPEATIYVLDSLNVTGGQALLVKEVLRMQESGKTIQEVIECAEELKYRAKIFFTVDSLEHLQRGGRIGKAAALAGNILNIKPIIMVSSGELLPDTKVRGHKKALKTLIDLTKAEFGDKFHEYNLAILYGEDSRKVDAQIIYEELFADGYSFTEIPLVQVGVTIGSHAGPTATGIAIVKKYDA